MRRPEPARPRHGGRRVTAALAAVAALTVGLAVGTQSAQGVPVPAAKPQPAAAPRIVPKPISTTVGKGSFRLTRSAKVVATGKATAVGDDLAAVLRPATGYRLNVVDRPARDGDIALRLVRQVKGLTSDTFGEGYRLDVTGRRVTATARTTHGLFNAVQTIRQLLPASIERNHAVHTAWTMPAVRVIDAPRYGYRGFMLDIARHYRTPAAVKQTIDRLAMYKINIFHLHLSDDQGFRVVINGFPRLTSVGGRGSLGTQGRTMDPGGFWTQAQYKSVVAYAAAHFMTLVPEVDSPGHTNAIVMSEYNDTSNPALTSNPKDINCTRNSPPKWNYTGDVGYSALCPESRNTYAILTAIISQLTAMSPGPIYNLGGDETPATTLARDRYARLVNTESGIVSGLGKTAMGWAEISGEGTDLPKGTIAQYWNPATGSDAGTETATDAVAKGMKLVMSPATHAYVDQKYSPGVPADTGLSWACSKGCDVDQFYNWDPVHYVDGIAATDVVGVEAAAWGETTRTIDEVNYLAFPRLLATAELGWSPAANRTATSPAYRDFLVRLGAQGPRLTASGTKFYRSPEVPWQ